MLLIQNSLFCIKSNEKTKKKRNGKEKKIARNVEEKPNDQNRRVIRYIAMHNRNMMVYCVNKVVYNGDFLLKINYLCFRMFICAKPNTNMKIYSTKRERERNEEMDSELY